VALFKNTLIRSVAEAAYELRLAAIHQTTAIAFIELDSEIAFDGDFLFTVGVNVDVNQGAMSKSNALIGSREQRSVIRSSPGWLTSSWWEAPSPGWA
jgi:hypothetical protein